MKPNQRRLVGLAVAIGVVLSLFGLGWSVPTGFRGMAYRQRPGRRPAMHLLFAARVTAISPVNELGIPEQLRRALGEDAAASFKPPPSSEPAYPYTFEMSPQAFTRVSRESDEERLKIEFLRWQNAERNESDAYFRVSNPGSREVLVWNMRQQLLATNVAAGLEWKNLKSDYPGRGWEKVKMPAGGSTEFPMSSPESGDWRVRLLYNRLNPELAPDGQAVRGDLEAIGPVIKHQAID